MEGANQGKEHRLVRKRTLEKQREEILLERARLLSLKNELGERQSKPSSETALHPHRDCQQQSKGRKTEFQNWKEKFKR